LLDYRRWNREHNVNFQEWFGLEREKAESSFGLIARLMQSIVLSVAKQFRVMKKQMRFVALLALSAGSIFAGCRTAHDVAVTSFRVIDAPAAYIRRHVDESDTVTTTTTADSDVVAPGRVIEPAPPTTQGRTTAQTRRSSTSNDANHSARTETVQAKPSPSRSPRVTTSQSGSQMPTAKPVPGKPGYVFSPFDPNGGYVDVTGYEPGDKVKDPYSKKIFVVP
jgi:hypothetical protein